jgi:hypothetical protein
MFKFNAFNLDDKVTYVGSRWSKELGGKMGWIVAPVINERNKYVVEFGDESYVMPEGSLAPFKATAAKETGPEIRQFRKRLSDEDK